MSIHRTANDYKALGSPSAEGLQRRSAGPVVLFIGAVLIAGMTCILYLWQQGQIVATQQDIRTLDARYTAMLAQENDLASQVNAIRSVTHVVAEATKDGMVMGDSRLIKTLNVEVPVPNTILVAQNQPSSSSSQSSVVLPSTNAAITSWWQDAWDGLFNQLQ